MIGFRMGYAPIFRTPPKRRTCQLASKQELKRYRSNLSDELHSAALYETLAKVEKDDTRKGVFAELATSEREHAKVWADKLSANGARPRHANANVKTRLMRGLIRVFGP